MGGCAVSVSPFGASAVEILEHLTVVSSGIATLGVIDEAVRTFRNVKDTDLALLACTSSYPAPPEEMHLRRIPHLAETFDVVPGLSDHTLGTAVPVAGVALGARIVEKHLTFSREEEGPDSDFFVELDEFVEMVQADFRHPATAGGTHKVYRISYPRR